MHTKTQKDENSIENNSQDEAVYCKNGWCNNSACYYHIAAAPIDGTPFKIKRLEDGPKCLGFKE